jgi:hypothetical protein
MEANRGKVSLVMIPGMEPGLGKATSGVSRENDSFGPSHAMAGSRGKMANGGSRGKMAKEGSREKMAIEGSQGTMAIEGSLGKAAIWRQGKMMNLGSREKEVILGTRAFWENQGKAANFGSRAFAVSLEKGVSKKTAKLD